MNLRKLILPVVFLALGVGGFVALKATKPTRAPAPVQEPVWRIETLLAEPSRLSPVVRLSGVVESPRLTVAAAPGLGRVARLTAREGLAVRRGQVLVELDARDFAPRVAQAEGAVAELEAAVKSEHLRHRSDLDQLAQESKLLDFARADVERFERLQQDNFYSQAAVDQSRASLSRQQITLRSRELAIGDHVARLAQLDARLAQARANLDQARLALERSRVTAPFDGWVAQVEVAEGDQVNTGQALVSLYPSDGLEIRAKVPATQQAALLAGVAGGVRPAASARVGATEVAMRFDRVAAAGDARGLDAFFRVTGGAGLLRIGGLVDVSLARPPVDDVVAVPYAALYNGRTVYVVDQGRLKSVAVETVGEAAGEPPRLLVRGLAQGARVMTTHLPNAVTGLKVEVTGK